VDRGDWEDLASVYRAGADKARGWVMNIDRQQEAEVLAAMADRCLTLALRRPGELPARQEDTEEAAWHRLDLGEPYSGLTGNQRDALWVQYLHETTEAPTLAGHWSWLRFAIYSRTGQARPV
jgi:hypothetical protein